jgi:hypothetical protein
MCSPYHRHIPQEAKSEQSSSVNQPCGLAKTPGAEPEPENQVLLRIFSSTSDTFVGVKVTLSGIETSNSAIGVLGYLRHHHVVTSSGESSRAALKGNTQMHDFFIGLAFVLMVISPAIVAAFSGSSEVEANAE